MVEWMTEYPSSEIPKEIRMAGEEGEVGESRSGVSGFNTNGNEL